MLPIGNDWDEILSSEFESDYYKKLNEYIRTEYQTQSVYPPIHNVFNALKATPYHRVRVVILGQDPYHGPGQSHGLCFSVQSGVKVPPSLINIQKELHLEYGYPMPSHGNLSDWAKEGVLLLNTILTVRDGLPLSHKGIGWERLTDQIIKKLNERSEPMVFLLWGVSAQKKAELIDAAKHLVLKTTHPSPLSAYRGFLGCGHFRLANEFLKDHGLGEVNWQITPEDPMQSK